MTSLRRLGPFALLVFTSCGSPAIISKWKKPDVATVSFQRVVVIAAARDPASRRKIEDQLVHKLKGRGVASYTLTPEAPVGDELHALIEQRKFDGAVVLRVVSMDREVDWVPGSWAGPYYGAEPRAEVDTSVRLETTVYELPSETLIWAGSSKTVTPKKLRALVNETVEVVSKEFWKLGMISPIPVAAR